MVLPNINSRNNRDKVNMAFGQRANSNPAGRDRGNENDKTRGNTVFSPQYLKNKRGSQVDAEGFTHGIQLTPVPGFQ